MNNPLLVPLEKSWGSAEPHVATVIQIAGDEAGQAMPKRVEKNWGYELHYRNDDLYCMKLLHFNGVDNTTSADITDYATSMHFHVIKHETLLVTRGTLTLEVIINKQPTIFLLEEGMAWVICPGHVHRLMALHGPVDIIEASTRDYDDDSVRIG